VVKSSTRRCTIDARRIGLPVEIWAKVGDA